MSSAPAAALSTAPLSLSQEEQNLKSLWTALSVAEKQRDRRGLEFGKACYELRASAEGVQGGTTFRPTLEKLGIPHSTAYFWIARYEESVGEREASPKVGIREAEPKPAAVAPVKTLGEMPAFGEAPEPAETAPKTYAEANDEELQALAHRLDSVLGKIVGITLDAQSLVDKPKWRGLLWRVLPSFPSVVAQCDKLAKRAAQLAETTSHLLTGSSVKPEVKPAKGEPAPQNDVDYVPEFLSQAEADELYSFLMAQPHKNNRLSYGPQVYPMKAQDVSAAWAANPQPEPDLIKALRERMSLRYGVPFNSVQCNYHGSESKVRNHPDTYGMVAMLRVGATRIFEIGDKPYGGCKYTGYEMPHGSLVTMKRSLQHKMSPQPGDVSISVIFRHVTPGQTDAGWWSDGKVNAVRNREHHRAYDAAVATVAPAKLGFLGFLAGVEYDEKSLESCLVDGVLSRPSSGKCGNAGMGSPTECWTYKTSESPKNAVASTLSDVDVLEKEPVPKKYYLSQKCCQGILRRAEARKKKIHPLYRRILTKVAYPAQ